MHPHGPATTVHWPTKDDVCWVPLSEILCSLQAPTTFSGRMYILNATDTERINKLLGQQPNRNIDWNFFNLRIYFVFINAGSLSCKRA